MKTQAEINTVIEILSNYPKLKSIITVGIDITTVLSRNAIKSLNKDEFFALCSLPLDIAIPPNVRELFMTRAREYGIKMIFDPETKLIKIKRIIAS
jgi:hypothetical protein